MQEIKNVLILGAGTLGSRIGLQAAISNYSVTVYDIHESALEQSLKVMHKVLKYAVRQGMIEEEDKPAILARIKFTTNPSEAVNDADIISESVTEEVTIKQKVWKQFGALAPAKTIFTTNTSYLLPSQFAAISGRPEKFCAFHFHDVFTARVVDIMPHPGTDPAIVTLLMDFGKRLNQVPVLVKKESPGYIFNFMLMSLIGAAGKLKTADVGSIEDIDKSWMVNFNMPMGPFGILDNVGLDTAWHVVKDRPDAASQAFAALLKDYIDKGKLGEKTGEGFYLYPHPAYKTFVETKQ
ncbi:MAG: 3-hydroxyacyl-CoA dehydrogenase [Bacteroidetes bacterium]|nr:3-hydroxyacyl-CoA dehydrogenase [Bacteroidota bacterium]